MKVKKLSALVWSIIFMTLGLSARAQSSPTAGAADGTVVVQDTPPPCDGCTPPKNTPAPQAPPPSLPAQCTAPAPSPNATDDYDYDHDGKKITWGCRAGETDDLSDVSQIDPSLTAYNDFYVVNQRHFLPLPPIHTTKVRYLRIQNSKLSLFKVKYAVTSELSGVRAFGVSLNSNTAGITDSSTNSIDDDERDEDHDADRCDYGDDHARKARGDFMAFVKTRAQSISAYSHVFSLLAELRSGSIDRIEKVHSAAFCASASDFGPVEKVHSLAAIFTGRNGGDSRAASFTNIHAGLLRIKDLSVGSISKFHTKLMIIRNATIDNIDNGHGTIILVNSHVKSITNFGGRLILRGTSSVNSIGASTTVLTQR